MAGQMPPLVIPSEGAVVIKSQLMDPAPLYIMNPKMVNRMSTMPKLNKRKMPNAMLWDLFFALWCFLVFIFYLLRFMLLDDIYSMLKLMIKVVKNKTTPNRNSAW